MGASGDVTEDALATVTDIIWLINFIFKSGPVPAPCQAAGDVNCDGFVTAVDVLSLVGYVLKSGPAPCDVCTLVPGTWSCP